MDLNTNMKWSAVLVRFGKGALSGAVAAMSMVTLSQPSVWSDFSTLVASLALAGTYGALTGFLLALQKYVSWKDDLYL